MTFLISPKNKKCGYRSNRTKNANSDSRQTNKCEMGANAQHTYIAGFAFLSNSKQYMYNQNKA